MKVYLAGPIAGTNDAQANEWRKMAAQFLTICGIDVLDPMARDFRGKEFTEGTPKVIVEGDKADIDACDIVLANCWQTSVGTSMEILYAWDRDKRVVIHVPADKPVSPWLTYHSILLTHSMTEALTWIRHWHEYTARRDAVAESLR
jgi:nucleoside 2-deoxyribosyltransferase